VTRFRAVVLIGLAILSGLGVVTAQLLAEPDAVGEAIGDGAAGLRAQQKLVELLMRGGGVSRRTDPVGLRWDELNALLSRHVESRGLRLRPVLVQPADEGVQLTGGTTIREVLPHLPLAWLGTVAPDAVLDRHLWVAVAGRLALRPGEGELVVERATVGRQRVPPGWLWRLLGLDARQLRWRMPRGVERVEVKPDQLVIYTVTRN
jgi:hypothetical protein